MQEQPAGLELQDLDMPLESRRPYGRSVTKVTSVITVPVTFFLFRCSRIQSFRNRILTRHGFAFCIAFGDVMRGFHLQ
jgi:hypothetical protein